ncbi:MAG: hypothetical protein LLG05_10490 [Porphyromonadaceae bacterium]|nr:hypothetical protein [Porphyromonadaceae bacterium]
MTLLYLGDYKTKKELKLHKGEYFPFYDPSMFGNPKMHPLDGEAVCLDHPKRNKFAQIWTDENGLLEKVA